jgi:hypothetical protein
MTVISRSLLGNRERSRFDAEAFQEEDVAHEDWLRDTCDARSLEVLLRGKARTILSRKSARGEMQYASITSINSQDGAIFPDLMLSDALPSRAKWVVQAGDILISQVRPERGAVGWVGQNLAGAVASSGCYLVPGSALPEQERAALFLYLRTDSARRQIVRRNRNSMYPAVAAQDVDQILIPKFSQDDLAFALGVMTDVENELAEMRLKRQEAELLISDLLKDTGMPPSPFESAKEVDSTVVSRADVVAAGRVDAEFFRSEYSDFAAKVSEGPHFALKDHFAVLAGRVVAGDTPIPIIKQAFLTNFGPNFGVVERELARAGRGVALKKGDIALASTAHEVAYVGRKVDQIRDVPEAIVDNQVVAELMIIRPRAQGLSVSASYVTDFLRHPAGRHQVQRCIRGLRGGHTYAQDIDKYVLIPQPGDAWMAAYESIASAGERARASAIKRTREGVSHMASRFTK